MELLRPRPEVVQQSRNGASRQYVIAYERRLGQHVRSRQGHRRGHPPRPPGPGRTGDAGGVMRFTAECDVVKIHWHLLSFRGCGAIELLLEKEAHILSLAVARVP